MSLRTNFIVSYTANKAVMSPAGRVDVDADVLIGVLVLEVEQLGAHGVGDVVVDRGAQEDDVLLEHPREQVVAPFAPVGLLEDARDVVLAYYFHLAPPVVTGYSPVWPAAPASAPVRHRADSGTRRSLAEID